MTEIKSYNNQMFDQATSDEILKAIGDGDGIELTTIGVTRPTEFYKLQMMLLDVQGWPSFPEAMAVAETKERYLELLSDLAIGLKVGIINANSSQVEFDITGLFESEATATVTLTPIAVLEFAKSIKADMGFKSVTFVKPEVER